MEKLNTIYYYLDLAGTFAFAISGATAARERGLDLFGICVIAYTVACGGGIIRDVCIGAITRRVNNLVSSRHCNGSCSNDYGFISRCATS